MPLTTEQKKIIEQTHREISLQLGVAGKKFYENLFEIAPDLKRYFKTDMGIQSMKIMQMIGFAVANMNAPATLSNIVRDLGKRHVGYGVEKEHFQVVGQALIMTFEQLLGDKFTPQAREAWLLLYQDLVAIATTAYAN